jgi:hypothetical protein
MWLSKRGNDARIGRPQYHGACDEKVNAVEKLRLAVKSASAKSVACKRPKPSSSSDVSFERRRREAASRRAVEENQSSVTARIRCWGKAAAAPNDRTTSSCCKVRAQACGLS